jgi:CheY-like chemotaxis protein
MILSKTMSSCGSETTEVSSGESCLEALRKAAERGEKYDLILLDYIMPGMDGLTTAENINKVAGTNAPAIILLSSDTRGLNSSKIQELGLVGYLIKPVKRKQLLSAIRHALGMAEAVVIKDTKKPETVEAPVIARALNILLVEDNKDNTNLVLAYLKSKPYTIDHAANGKIAVELFTAGQYDLVLMDIEMPVMDGLTAIRKIRRWENENDARSTPIVALTAHALKEHEEKSHAAGANSHITKPIRKAKLLEVISTSTQMN